MEGRIAGRIVDAEAIDAVVQQLRKIEERTGIDRTVAIGELILTRFFGANPDVWRDRRRNKGNSIRRLAQREDCPFGKSALNDAVGVYLAIKETPSVQSFGHITASHVAAVLTLQPAERERLLRQANLERLGVRALRARVSDIRRASGERRGRPPATQEQRLLAGLMAAERRLQDKVKELQALNALSPSIQQQLQHLACRLSSVETQVRSLGRQSGRHHAARTAERQPD